MNIILFEEDERFLPSSDERCVHIRKILKKKKGDDFAAGLIGGPTGRAVITEDGARGIAFSFEAEAPCAPLYPLRLLVGFPRPIQLKRLLRAVASLGVSGLLLCGTDLGEKSYMKSGLLEGGGARAALVAGAMQSGSSAIPSIERAETLDAALALVESSFPAAHKTLVDIAATDGSRPPVLGSCARGDESSFKGKINAKAPLFLAIGSERGWSGRERALFASFGWQARSLGPRILRTETATDAACAVALFAYGLWDA